MEKYKNKRGVLTGIVLFMLFMAVCTVVAKGIYKNGLAKVQICNPKQRNLHYEINARGNILPGETYGIYVPAGLRVYTVGISVGEQIHEGDVLFEIDMEDLESRIKEESDTRDYLKAQIKDFDNARNVQSSEKKKLEEQLLADYDNLIREQELRVNNAKLAEESAKLKMEAEAFSFDSSDSDLDYLLYKKEYKQAQNAVKQAELDMENAIKEWNRSLEEARTDVSADTAERVKKAGDLAACERTLEQMRSIKESDGKICAKEEGTVLECLVETGNRIGDGACVIYTKTGEGVEVSLAESEGRILSIGDSVSLKCKSSIGETKNMDGIIRYMENANGQSILHITADVSGLAMGQTVQMNYSYDSDNYNTVIPAHALYHEDRGSFVYIVEEVEGILGMEKRIRKVTVTVLESNDEYAVISSESMGPEIHIVESSNKELEENAAVRVM